MLTGDHTVLPVTHTSRDFEVGPQRGSSDATSLY